MLDSGGASMPAGASTKRHQLMVSMRHEAANTRHEAPSEVSHNRGSGNRINQAWRTITAVSAKRTTVGSMLRNGRAAVNQTWINRQCVTSSFTSGVSRRVNVHQQRSRGLRVDRATFKVARINNAENETRQGHTRRCAATEVHTGRLRNCRAIAELSSHERCCNPGPEV